MLKNLINKAVSAEFDYNLLSDCLSNYKRPRNQITKLLKNKDIIRVKKGLYVFGPQIKDKIYSKEILANLIYGPSYISLEYALAYYGLIPEKVETLTSITNKRNKKFHTPVGTFSYQYLPSEKYYLGITQIKIDAKRMVFFATREKALIDKIYKEKNIKTKEHLKAYLVANLRIDLEEFKKLKLMSLRDMQKVYKNKIIKLLIELLESLK